MPRSYETADEDAGSEAPAGDPIVTGGRKWLAPSDAPVFGPWSRHTIVPCETLEVNRSSGKCSVTSSLQPNSEHRVQVPTRNVRESSAAPMKRIGPRRVIVS